MMDEFRFRCQGMHYVNDRSLQIQYHLLCVCVRYSQMSPYSVALQSAQCKLQVHLATSFHILKGSFCDSSLSTSDYPPA